jgi:dihydroflavonol-4-reductase
LSVLVTGADTILGFQITRALGAAGFLVRVLVPEEAGADTASSAGVQVVAGETADVESCLEALEDTTAVFHCESGHLIEAGPRAVRDFIEGTRNLLVAMSRAGVEDIVYAGSAFLFEPGDEDEPGDESAAWDNPLGLMCLEAHRAAADLLQRYNESGKLRCVTISPTLLMGDHDMPGGAGWWLIDRVNRGAMMPTGAVNVVNARDAAAAAVKALGRGKPGASYLLGGENVADSDLLAQIAGALGVGIEQSGEVTRPGKALRALKKLSPRIKAPKPEIARLGEIGLYYTSALAESQLGLEVTPARQTVLEAVRWFVSRSSQPAHPRI